LQGQLQDARRFGNAHRITAEEFAFHAPLARSRTDTTQTANVGNAGVTTLSRFWGTGSGTYGCTFTSATVVCLQE
jgi:hypothetical protein